MSLPDSALLLNVVKTALFFLFLDGSREIHSGKQRVMQHLTKISSTTTDNKRDFR